MKSNFFHLIVTIALFQFGCSQSHERIEEGESKSAPAAQEIVVDEASPEPSVMKESNGAAAEKSPNSFISSSAAVDNGDTLRKFIRTADLKFNVKNVIRSTYRIENITKQFGGYVTKTTLRSNIENTTIIPVSEDSSLETVYYTVENILELRVPAKKLDTTLKTISQLINFLDFRIIQAQDVSLDIFSHRLAQNRLTNYRDRMGKAIDSKGKKLNETSNAEENLLNRQEQSDNEKIANLSLLDKIDLSTINITIYQKQTLKRELVSNDKNTDAYEPGFWRKFSHSVKYGWHLLQSVIIFIVQLWGLIILGLLIYLLFKFLQKILKKP